MVLLSFVPGIATLYPSKSDLIKAAVANISCLFIEAAKHDYDEESLRIFLHDEHINGQRTEKLCRSYANSKRDIQTQLELTGNNIPHIVDIDWRLHHCVKVNSPVMIRITFMYYLNNVILMTRKNIFCANKNQIILLLCIG